MKFAYALLKRIESYFQNNILFFCAFALISVLTVFILIVAYVTSDPYIQAKKSTNVYYRSMHAELLEKDTKSDFINLIDATKQVDSYSYHVVQSFLKDNVRIAAASNNNCVNGLFRSNGSVFKGKSCFTENENNNCSMIAVVGKNSEALPGDTIETPFGTFLVVGKNCSVNSVIIVPYGTFLSLVDVPNRVEFEFSANIIQKDEERILKLWNEILPGHNFGQSRHNAILSDSFQNVKIAFVLCVLSFLVTMTALNYFDSQNNSSDVLMRLTGATRLDIVLLSASAKTVVMVAMSITALGMYDLIILSGITEIGIFGKIFSLEIRDRLIILTLCVAAVLVTVISATVKEIASKPFELA